MMKAQLIIFTMAVILSAYATPLLADDDDGNPTGTSLDIATVNNSHASQLAQLTQPLTTNVNEEVVKAKGQIVAIHNNLIIIKVSKVEHFQLNGNIVQADVQNAQFKLGNRANLRLNTFVEVKGRWDGNRLFASHVEFEDKGRWDGNRPYTGEVEVKKEVNFSEDSAEVKGQVLVIQQNLVILTADKTKGFDPSLNMVAADIRNTQFKHGYHADLRINAVVEIKGHWEGNRLYAREVKFENED